jgi:hypothetical protein
MTNMLTIVAKPISEFNPEEYMMMVAVADSKDRADVVSLNYLKKLNTLPSSTLQSKLWMIILK